MDEETGVEVKEKVVSGYCVVVGAEPGQELSKLENVWQLKDLQTRFLDVWQGKDLAALSVAGKGLTGFFGLGES